MTPKLVLSTWFPFWCAGFTVYPYIFIRTTTNNWTHSRESRQKLVRHECIHILQYQRMGWFEFVFKYLAQLWQEGYRENKYEEEAWAHDEEHEPQILPKELEDFVQAVQ